MSKSSLNWHPTCSELTMLRSITMPHSVPIEGEQSATHCRWRLTNSTLNMKSSVPSETPAPTDQHKRRHDSVEYKLKIYIYNLKINQKCTNYTDILKLPQNYGVVKCDSKLHTGAPRIFVAIGHKIWYDMIRYDMIYLLTAIGLTPDGSSTVHIYADTIYRKTQWKQNIQNRTRRMHKHKNKSS